MYNVYVALLLVNILPDELLKILDFSSITNPISNAPVVFLAFQKTNKLKATQHMALWLQLKVVLEEEKNHQNLNFWSLFEKVAK